MRTILLVAAASVFVIIAVAAWALPRLYAEEFDRDFTPPTTAWATSDTCANCHQDQHASWYRTFHRTMTQEATATSVKGRFDGQIYKYWGVSVRPVQRDGHYLFEYLDDSGEVAVTQTVQRTVGSRRYQQYLAKTPGGGETYYRLHLLWHMDDERWMHINGVFLRPDEQGFDDLVAVWNQNCIFCHNTGPQPRIQNFEEMGERARAGQPVNPLMEALFDSEVAELGIACETCHGPGAVHAQRNRNPLRRYALHLSGADDPTITHPRKVTQQQSIDICGQCHGQRTPRNREEFMAWINTGPSFRAGGHLADYVSIVHHDQAARPGFDPDEFALRFWSDGTPRLTAYEYQGLTQSACFDGGDISCISCHTLHSGDVHGNISEQNRGNTPCLSCHTELADDISAHTKHAADSTGSVCYECHMAKMVFGVTEIHRSHRIEIPQPKINHDGGRPDACINCHVEASTAWSQRKVDELWGSKAGASSSLQSQVSGLIEALHSGDPVQRAVAARLAGRADAPGNARERAWLIPHLLRAMEDNYPSTRNLSRKSLKALQEQLSNEGIVSRLGYALEQYDFIAEAEQRAVMLEAIQQAWLEIDKNLLPTPQPAALLDADWLPLEPATSELIRDSRTHTKQISIGE